MSTRSAIFGSQAQHTHEDEEQTNANDAAIVLTTFGCSPLHEVRGTRENFCSCEIGCARNDQSPSRQGRPLGLSSSPPAGEAAPDASKWSRQPSFRPTKLPDILTTPHRDRTVTEAALRLRTAGVEAGGGVQKGALKNVHLSQSFSFFLSPHV